MKTTLLPPELNILRPVVVNDLRRVGSKFDGGYVLPERVMQRVTTLVTFGLALDWTFEAHFVKEHPGCRLRAFDFTTDPNHFKKRFINGLKRLPLARKGCWHDLVHNLRMHRSFKQTFSGPKRAFFPQRVCNRIDTPYVITIDQIFAGLENEGEVLLKIDIEGSEYRLIEQMLRYASRVPCLLMEFHDTEPFRHCFLEKIQQILESYHIVHLHGNNFIGAAADGLPEVLEFTFLRKDLLSGDVIFRHELPLAGLDQPNLPSATEFALRFTSRDTPDRH